MTARRFVGPELACVALVFTMALATRARASEPEIGTKREASAQLTKGQCVDANGLGQELRRAFELASARDKFQACASASCPALVRQDCTQRLDELEQAQPTVVLSVKDAFGNDLSQVSVSVDGNVLTDRLDGAAANVDIGERTFTFEAEGHAPLARTLVISAGEKLRRIEVELTPLHAEPTVAQAGATASASSEPPRGAESRSRRAKRTKLAGLVSGGVGVALLASGTAFAFLASARWSDAKLECPTYEQCSPGAIRARDSAASYAMLANVGIIGGGVLAALGVTLVLTSQSTSEPSAVLSVAPMSIRLTGRY